MGCVQQAVLDFDEEIQAPWRPRLVAVGVSAGAESPPAPVRRPHPSGRSSARVGVCRPPESPTRPGAPRMRPATPAAPPARPVLRRSAPLFPSAAGLRLTRRARRLSAVLALAVGLAIGSWVAPLLAGGSDDFRLAGVQSVVVQPGDTLWSIAADAAGTDDVREVVDRIQALNGLHDSVLIPGQVLELP